MRPPRIFEAIRTAFFGLHHTWGSLAPSSCSCAFFPFGAGATRVDSSIGMGAIPSSARITRSDGAFFVTFSIRADSKGSPTETYAFALERATICFGKGSYT